MRSDVVKAVAARLSSLRRARRDRLRAARQRCGQLLDDARREMAAVGGMRSERRAAVARRLVDIGQARAERSVERQQAMSDMRLRLARRVGERLAALREEMALCKAYWSAEVDG